MKKWLSNKWFLRSITAAATAAALYGSTIVTVKASRYFLANTVDENIQEYVEQNLENIIRAQEERLGFAYSQRPTIEYKLPPENRSFSWDGDYLLGRYKADEDTIYINSGFHLAPLPDNGDFLASLLVPGQIGDVDNTLYHELGHFYCDKLSEELGLGNWPSKERADSLEELVGFKIVAEGIAQYFELKMSPREDLFKDEYWPASIYGFLDADGGIDPFYCYQGGYHLVKPIIDQYGPIGILALMIELPDKSNILHLSKYQELILRALKTVVPNPK